MRPSLLSLADIIQIKKNYYKNQVGEYWRYCEVEHSIILGLIADFHLFPSNYGAREKNRGAVIACLDMFLGELRSFQPVGTETNRFKNSKKYQCSGFCLLFADLILPCLVQLLKSEATTKSSKPLACHQSLDPRYLVSV